MNSLLKEAVKFTYRNNKNVRVLQNCLCSTKSAPPSPSASAKPSSSASAKPSSSASATSIKDVPGLSKKTLDVPSTEVGAPKASKKSTYKNPEYFCYHNQSYFEAEVEMMKYRLPQPTNKVPLSK